MENRARNRRFQSSAPNRLSEDIEVIRRAFPQTYVLRPPKTHNLVAIATPEEAVGVDELMQRGRALDDRFGTELSFAELAGQILDRGD